MTAVGTTSRVAQLALGFQSGSDDVGSVWIKRGPGHNGTSNARLRHSDGVVTTTVNFVPATTWERKEVTKTMDGSSTQSKFEIWVDITTGSQSVYVWHPQLESGIAASPYRSNAATAAGIVASWPDQGGSGNDMGQETQASQPLVIANSLDGYNGVMMDGVNDSVYATLPAALTYPFAFYFVGRITDVTPTPSQLKPMLFGSGESILVSQSTSKWQMWNGAFVTSTDDSTLNPVVVEAIFNSTSSSLSLNFGTPNTGNTGTRTPSDVIRLGAHSAGGDEHYVYEALLIDGLPSSDDRTHLADYFATKYPTLGI
jgi:hypothetical protein